jgi:hypothetical protein
VTRKKIGSKRDDVMGNWRRLLKVELHDKGIGKRIKAFGVFVGLP